MEFEEVIERSHDVESFNNNVLEYFQSHDMFDKEERRRHFWALFYQWKEKILGGAR